MRRNNNSILIISHSGRSLAASARRAWLHATVVDRFADADTQSQAGKCIAVDGDAMGIDARHLQLLLQGLDRDEFAGVVIGSGLEGATGIIAELQERWPYYGNGIETWIACTNSAIFAEMLDQLDIRYPEIQPELPGSTGNWLVKQNHAAGGGHIKPVQDAPAGLNDIYYQRYIEGRNISVVFLADANDALIIGMSETEVVNRDEGDFRYAGAVSSVSIAAAAEQRLQEIIHALVKQLELRGLCGIDVVVDYRDQCWLLELNPRPTATFELYEREESLLAAHISACHGQLPVLTPVSGDCGHHIIYSDGDLHIPALSWPAWVTDRPLAGKSVRAGEPVCTVHAQARNALRVRQELQSRTAWLQEQFSNYYQAA